MGRLSYVAILAFVLVGCLWLEVVLRTRVLRRWRRLLLSVLPGAVVFAVWDAYAVAAGHWSFGPGLVLGLTIPGGVPLDEVLFFVVVPLAAILTLEAVRSVNDRWVVGDEGTSDPAGDVESGRAS